MKTALLIAMMATPATAATVRYFDDPEPIEYTVFEGRPSFAKSGPYVATEKWEPKCEAASVYKNLALDRVERICKAPFVNTPQGAATPQPNDVFYAAFLHFSAYYFPYGHAAYSPSTFTDWYRTTYHEQHITYETRKEVHHQPKPVPLPSAFWLLLGGMALLTGRKL